MLSPWGHRVKHIRPRGLQPSAPSSWDLCQDHLDPSRPPSSPAPGAGLTRLARPRPLEKEGLAEATRGQAA